MIAGTVTELRNKHAQGEKTAGINVRKGAITNILEENVVQPLLVSTSAVPPGQRDGPQYPED